MMNMDIERTQFKQLKKFVSPGKVLILLGPRRCGKTTLLKQFSSTLSEKYLFINGEDLATQEILTSQSVEKLTSFIGNNKCLIIDEAQKIPRIGLNLKLIVDHMPLLKVLVTGSSAFDLLQQTGEPLTGRKYTLKLYPLAQMEIGQTENYAQTHARLEERLIYGGYPEAVLINDLHGKAMYLKEIVSSYLYKDILELEGVRHADKLVHLLQLLVFQIGKEVSLTELGAQVGLNKITVDRYLDLLQKAFVLVRLGGLSRNLRKEISKNSRYYFYDLGIRNALINNFNPLSQRDDVGMLWENYIVIERLKKQEYKQIFSNNYFWRTHDKKEIDWVEEREGSLFAYEIKWASKKMAAPALWNQTYPHAHFDLINKDNYLEFIS